VSPAERAVLPAPVKAKRHVQTPAERRAIYAEVTARDLAAAPQRNGCRALDIDPDAGPCSGKVGLESKTERHHAGITIGSKRVTRPDRLVCLCDGHHDRWAPSHNRLIMGWLAKLYGGR
jgi:hypothetical protein